MKSSRPPAHSYQYAGSSKQHAFFANDFMVCLASAETPSNAFKAESQRKLKHSTMQAQTAAQWPGDMPHQLMSQPSRAENRLGEARSCQGYSDIPALAVSGGSCGFKSSFARFRSVPYFLDAKPLPIATKPKNYGVRREWQTGFQPPSHHFREPRSARNLKPRAPGLPRLPSRIWPPLVGLTGQGASKGSV